MGALLTGDWQSAAIAGNPSALHRVRLGAIDLRERGYSFLGETAAVIFPVTGDYDLYELHAAGMMPSDQQLVAMFRVSTDGGLTLRSGANDYGYNFEGAVSDGGNSNADDQATTIAFRASGDVQVDDYEAGTYADHPYNGFIRLYRPQDAAATHVFWESDHGEVDGANARLSVGHGHGVFRSTDAITHVGFTFEGLTDIAIGKLAFYGMNLS